MKWEYEKACKEAGMSEENVREIRRMFDNDYKKLKHKKRVMKELGYSCWSLYMQNEDGDYVFDTIPDSNSNVEEVAMHNLEMGKLMRLLDSIGKENRELILAAYDNDELLKDFISDHGMTKKESEIRIGKIMSFLTCFMY